MVHTVNFKFYVKHVLPREWTASWNNESLPAGAMAVKSYAWWHAGNAHKNNPGPECYDVDATEDHQVFDPDFEHPYTNAAVDATWDYYMIQGDNVVQAFFEAGNDKTGNDPEMCGWFYGEEALGDKMSQNGSYACAEDGMSWALILMTYYFPPLVSWTKVDASLDQDQDGCINWEEIGPDEVFGGQRNPLYFWDFFDPTRDKAVALGDFNAVLARFGSSGDQNIDPLSDPPPPPAYHTRFDRGGNKEGVPWDNPASGQISLADFLSLLRQYGHNCMAPP